MIKIKKDNVFYSFSKDNSPILKVDSGAEVVFETRDCFSDQINKPEDFTHLDWSDINPATGPIYINGAKRGDILKIDLIKIDINSKGTMCLAPGGGVLGAHIEKPIAKVLEVTDKGVIFNENLIIPLNKMVGVIGVAPSGDDVPTGVPGAHGGNMDNKVITEGATLYLPVFQDGALFGLGDLHAAMGDGEVGITGVESCGEVTVKLTVIKDSSYMIDNPLLEDKDHYYTIASAETVEEASYMAVSDMSKLLQRVANLSFEDSIMFASAAGDLQIAQIVDPLMTVRFRISKSVLGTHTLDVFI